MKPNAFTLVAFQLAGSRKRKFSFAFMLCALVLAGYYFTYKNIISAVAAAVIAAAFGYALLDAFVIVMIMDLYRGLTANPSLGLSTDYPLERVQARINRVLAQRGIEYFDSNGLVGLSKMILGMGKSQVIVCRNPEVAIRLSQVENPPTAIFYDDGDSKAATLAEIIKAKVQLR